MSSQSVTIGGQYWDAQLRTFDALDSGEYDLVVFRVGYAGGKTITGCDWIHQTAVQVPESDNLVMAPNHKARAAARQEERQIIEMLWSLAGVEEPDEVAVSGPGGSALEVVVERSAYEDE
jgi:hypothetical protein